MTETLPDVLAAVDRLRQLVRGETVALPDDPSCSSAALQALRDQVSMVRTHPRLRAVVAEVVDLAIRAARLREAGLDGEGWSYAELVGGMRVLEATLRPVDGA